MVTLRDITTKLREIPGGVLIGEYFRKRASGRKGSIEIHDFDGDLTMHLDLGEHMQSQIYWHGSYSRNVIFLLKSIAKRGMTFLDGGANIGEISLVAAKKVGPDGRVFAFEPIERFANQLARNRDSNGLLWIDLHRFGLSDQVGEAPIYLSDTEFSDGTQHDGLGTLFRSEGRNRASSIIPLTTIDDFVSKSDIGRMDIIKLDIEGGELPALIGARRTIEEHSPDFIVEVAEETCRAAGYRMHDIILYLEQFGYFCQRIGRRGKLSPIDGLNLSPFQNVYCVKAK